MIRLLATLIIYCGLMVLGVFFWKSHSKVSHQNTHSSEADPPPRQPHPEKTTAFQESIIKGAIPPANYTIDLAVFSNERAAKHRLRALERQGVKAFFTPVHREGRVLFRVRVGVFLEQEEANAEAKRLESTLGIKTRIARL